jgi:hypothetical protein
MPGHSAGVILSRELATCYRAVTVRERSAQSFFSSLPHMIHCAAELNPAVSAIVDNFSALLE